MDNEKKLTIKEAYNAMYQFLEYEYNLVNTDEVACLLSSMSTLPDGGTADPAAWEQWIDAVNASLAGEVNTRLTFQSED